MALYTSPDFRAMLAGRIYVARVVIVVREVIRLRRVICHLESQGVLLKGADALRLRRYTKAARADLRCLSNYAKLGHPRVSAGTTR